MTTIALVNDDRKTLTSVSNALEAEGYRTQTYSDGATALVGLQETPPDIAILDTIVPRISGTDLMLRLRLHSTLPVIFLTSEDAETEELFCLKMGADDFIRQPFSQRVLMERIKVVLRRTQSWDMALDNGDETHMMRRGKLLMDPDRHFCTWDEKLVTLTVTEYQIMHALALRPGIVKSREALADATRNDQVNMRERTVDSHIKRLRKKLLAIDAGFEAIKTIYGIGYQFRET